MPRVPTYQPFQVQPTVGPGPTFDGPRGPGPAEIAGEQLQQMGAAISGAGQQLGEYAQAQQMKMNKARLRDVANQFRTFISQTELDYSELDDVDVAQGGIDDFNQRVLQKRSELEQSLGNEWLRENFAPTADELFFRYSDRALAFQADRAEAYSQKQLEISILAGAQEVALNYHDADAFSDLNDLLTEQIEPLSSDPENLQTLRYAKWDAIASETIQNMIEGGRFAEAQEFYENSKQYISPGLATNVEISLQNAETASRIDAIKLDIFNGDMTREQLAEILPDFKDNEQLELQQYEETIRNRRDAEQAALDSERYANNRAELELGIVDGNVSRATIDRALENDDIKPGDHVILARQIAAQSEKLRGVTSFANLLRTGIALDPNDAATKRGADQFFETQMPAQMWQQDFDGAMAYTNNFIQQTGIVPSSVVSRFNALRINGSDEQQVSVISATADLYNANPEQAMIAFDDNIVTEAIRFDNMVANGIAPLSAIKTLQTDRSVDPRDQAVLSVARDVAEKIDVPRIGRIKDPITGREDMVGQQIYEQQFRDMFVDFYAIHQNKNDALEQTTAIMRRNWNESQFFQNRVMQFPPESFAPSESNKSLLNADWMRQSLDNDLSSYGLSADDVVLISDPQTAADVADYRRKLAAGETITPEDYPTYNVTLVEGGQITGRRVAFVPDELIQNDALLAQVERLEAISRQEISTDAFRPTFRMQIQGMSVDADAPLVASQAEQRQAGAAAQYDEFRRIREGIEQARSDLFDPLVGKDPVQIQQNLDELSAQYVAEAKRLLGVE